MAVSRPFNCLVVGNSRLYRGVNPDVLGPAVYNFAQDADAFNQTYYKLVYLNDHGIRFRTLIAGIDYFDLSSTTSSRNAVYGRFFRPEYLKDFDASDSGSLGFVDRVFHPIDEARFNLFMTATFSKPASDLMDEAIRRLLHDRRPPSMRLRVRDNGQLVMEGAGIAHAWDVLRRDATRLPLQVRYFDAMLEWARAHDVRVALVVPPTRDVALAGYEHGAVEETDRWFAEKASAAGAAYLNYSRRADFSMDDFADVDHLTTVAADRFSAILAADLDKLGLLAPCRTPSSAP